MWAALSLVVLITFLSLAADMGRVHVARAELRAAADAAAMHGISGIDDSSWSSKAISAAQDNLADGSQVVLSQSDVELGTGDFQTQTFAVGGTAPNAVRVTASRRSASGNPVPLALGGFFGRSSVDVAATSIAARQGATSARRLVALYEFNEGSGNVVRDTSGTGTAADLTIKDPANVSWVQGGGLRINTATELTSTSTKFAEMLSASNRFTIEVRFNPTQSTAQTAVGTTLLSIGNGSSDAGVSMGLKARGMTGLVRTTNTASGGSALPPTSGNHVPGSFNGGYSMVTTYDGNMFRLGGRRHADNAMRYRSASPGGTFNWNRASTLTVGSAGGGIDSFTGIITRIAIYDYDITTSEVDTLLTTGRMPAAPSGSSSTGTTRLLVR